MLVGLAAETGESGDRGIAHGDLSERDGRVVFCAAEMLRDSLGLAAVRAAYIVAMETVRIWQLDDRRQTRFLAGSLWSTTHPDRSLNRER